MLDGCVLPRFAGGVRKMKRTHVLRFGVSCVLAVIAFSLPAFAQEAATLNGRVTDPAGLAIDGATVSAQNTDTTVVSRAVTGDSGLYTIFPLLPGPYRVTVEKQGFRQVVQSGITLHVADSITLNFSLIVGAVSQAVSVTTEAPVVDVTTSNLGGLVDEQQVADLPLNGRNFTDLSILEPGVQRAWNLGTNNADIATTIFSSHGQPIRSNAFLMDGSLMQGFHGFSAASVGADELGVDGVKEYKVISNNAPPDYGVLMGAQTAVTSKGGSNQWHGDAYDYLRNAALDARDFFDVSYLTTGHRVPQFQKNQFGGAVGGPIRKNKTFIWLVNEWVKQTEGIPQPYLTTFQPGCIAPAGTTITNTECPQLGAAFPSVVVSQVTAPLLALYAPFEPNVPGTNSFFYNFKQPLTDRFGQARVDQVLGPNDNMFARYTTEVANITGTNIGGHNGNEYLPDFTDVLYSADQFVTISENHIFSPSFVNTFGFSWSRSYIREDTTTTVPSTDNVPGVNDVYAVTQAQQELQDGEPLPVTVYFNSGLAPNWVTNGAPAVYIQNIWALRDDLFKTKNKHSFKWGTLIQHVQYPMWDQTQTDGAYSFNSLGEFIEGEAQQYIDAHQFQLLGQTIQQNYNREFWYWTLGFYFGDEWHVSRNLTLSLGGRYEPNTQIGESHNRQDNFFAGPIVGEIGAQAIPTPGPIYKQSSLENFSPRVGFAWDVFGNGKTSLRGAFGIYFDTPLIGTMTQEIDDMPPEASGYSVTGAGGADFAATIPFVQPASGVLPSAAFQFIGADAKSPYSNQWNLTVERQLPGNTNLTVSYVGSRDIHLWVGIEGNPCIPSSYTSYYLPHIGLYSQAPVWDVPCGLGRTDVPNYTNAQEYFDTDGQSWYHGLEVALTRRLWKGFQFQNSFTYSKSLDDGETMKGGEENDGGSLYGPLLGVDYGVSIFSPKFDDRLNLLYHIPGMKSEGFLGKLTNGWWTGSLWTIQSGYPFSPRTAGSQSQSDIYHGNQGDRPDFGANYNPSTFIVGTANEWFNPNMLTLGTLGELGNTMRDDFRGPREVNWDMSINKDTKVGFLGEAGMIQFRCEFFNIMNHENLGQPNINGADIQEAASNNAGAIVATGSGTTTREIQFALKLIF
jgi:hypothetical protein